MRVWGYAVLVRRVSRLPFLGYMPARYLAVHGMDAHTTNLGVICVSMSNNYQVVLSSYYSLIARASKVVAGKTEREDPGSGLHRVAVVRFSSRSSRRRHRSFIHFVRCRHQHRHNIEGYH